MIGGLLIKCVIYKEFEMKKVFFGVFGFSLVLVLVCSQSFAQMGGQRRKGNRRK
jgi:hypothetical protein